LAGAVWAGAPLAGAFWAHTTATGSKTTDAAATNFHEGNKQVLGFIIQGIPCLLSRPVGKNNHPDG
jgi:hypothetical protein